MDHSSAPTTGQRRRQFWRSAWLTLGVPAGVLVLLTINVLAHGPLIGTDQWIRASVQSLAHSRAWQWLGRPAGLIIDIADPGVAVPVLLVSALAVSARRRSLRPLCSAAVAGTLLLVIVIPAKILIGRLAPGQLQIAPGARGAFPSGHATTAAVCYVLAVLLLLPYVPALVRRAALAALPVWCLLVGAALVWNNYHWLTDVVAGWALAAIIIQVTVRVTRGAYSALSTPPGVRGELIASPSRT